MRRCPLIPCLLAVVSLLASTAGCGESAPAPASPSTVRVAALSPALGATLRDLGLESLIVARHGYDTLLDQSLPTGGDQAGLDYESLLRVRPTHVVLEWGSRELPPRLLSLGARHGWTIRTYPLLTLDDIRTATRDLAGLVGDGAARERAESLVREMDRAWSARPSLSERAGRTLALYWTSPPGAAGPGSFHHQIIEAIGLEPALRTGAPYITLDVETVERLDPDSILLIMPGADPERLAELLGPLGRLRAFAEGRVAVVGHPLSQTPCPAMAGVADEVADAVARWPAR